MPSGSGSIWGAQWDSTPRAMVLARMIRADKLIGERLSEEFRWSSLAFRSSAISTPACLRTFGLILVSIALDPSTRTCRMRGARCAERG